MESGAGREQKEVKMKGPCVKAENVPKRQREQLAAPLLKIVRKAFEDPQIVEEFEAWREKRRKESEHREAHKEGAK